MSISKLLKFITIVLTAVATVYGVWPAFKAAFEEIFPSANMALNGEWTCVAHCEPDPAHITQDPTAPFKLLLFAETPTASAASGSYAPNKRQVFNKGIYGIVVKDERVINWMLPGATPKSSEWDVNNVNTSNGTAWVRWPVQWKLIGAALFVGLVVGYFAPVLWSRLRLVRKIDSKKGEASRPPAQT